MAKKKQKCNFRYFLSVGDGDDVVELTEQQAEEMQAKEPDLEVEELDEEEDEVKLEEVEVGGVDTDDSDMDKDDEDEDETTDEDEDETTDEDEGTCSECGKEPCECDEDEDEEDADKDEEMDEDEEGTEELTFEVQFEDGAIGKMDKIAYEHVQRFLDVTKKGDRRGDSLSQVLALTSRASKIIGPKFDIETYTKGDSVDTEAIKRDVIRKAMPGVVVSGLRGHALDSLYKSAVKTYSKKKDSYENDLSKLCDVAPSIVSDKAGDKDMVSVAKKKFMARIHKKGE